MIALTPKGVKLCEKIAQALATYKPATLSELSLKEKQQLLSLLTKTSFAPKN